jgi:hypothetical protein
VRDGTRWHVRWYETSVATVSRCPSRAEYEGKDGDLYSEVIAFTLNMIIDCFWEGAIGKLDHARKRFLQRLMLF